MRFRELIAYLDERHAVLGEKATGITVTMEEPIEPWLADELDQHAAGFQSFVPLTASLRDQFPEASLSGLLALLEAEGAFLQAVTGEKEPWHGLE